MVQVYTKVVGLWSLLAVVELKYGRQGTRAAVFAAGVDGVDHRRCFQLTDALERRRCFQIPDSLKKARPRDESFGCFQLRWKYRHPSIVHHASVLIGLLIHALYVTHEMLLEKVNEVSMENRMVERETEFMWHTIFQGLGERSRPMIRVDQHVITTRVGNNKSRSAEKTRLRVVPTRR